jgi:hypothetical protein
MKMMKLIKLMQLCNFMQLYATMQLMKQEFDDILT